MFLGLRTVIHPVADLDAAKAWWTGVLGAAPYFDEPFYVGFEVGGYELGLLPSAEPAPSVTYWGVRDADVAVAELVRHGATVRDAVSEVGEGIRVASVVDPNGSLVGIIENPHFEVKPVPPGTGPGR